MSEIAKTYPSGRLGKIFRFEVQTTDNALESHLKRTHEIEAELNEASIDLAKNVTAETLERYSSAFENSLHESTTGLNRKRSLVIFDRKNINLPSRKYLS